MICKRAQRVKTRRTFSGYQNNGVKPLLQLRRSVMFIALRLIVTASSVGATCFVRRLVATGKTYSAPKELTKYLVASSYEHSVPTGLR